MLRARNVGAEAIVVWSTSTGMDARMFNTRATMGWDVPFVGHPSMSSGDIRSLLDKPANWEKVYAVGYRSCSYDANGKLPPRNEEFVAQLKGKVELSDTLLGRWIQQPSIKFPGLCSLIPPLYRVSAARAPGWTTVHATCPAVSLPPKFFWSGGLAGPILV